MTNTKRSERRERDERHSRRERVLQLARDTIRAQHLSESEARVRDAMKPANWNKSPEMVMTDAGAAFHYAYSGGHNFMTPNAIRQAWIVPGVLAYELATGPGLLGPDPLFGLTFAEVTNQEMIGGALSYWARGRSDLSFGGAEPREKLEAIIRTILQAVEAEGLA